MRKIAIGPSIASGVALGSWTDGEPQQAADHVQGMAPAALPTMVDGARNDAEGGERYAERIHGGVDTEVGCSHGRGPATNPDGHETVSL